MAPRHVRTFHEEARMEIGRKQAIINRDVNRVDGGLATRTPGESVKLDTLLLSQSGAISPYLNDSGARRPLVPGLEGFFESIKVTGLSPSGVRFENTFAIDDKGFVQGGSGQPLGHVPYQLTLVGKDGSEFTTVVDITPKKTKVSHQGYESLSGLVLERVKEPPPPPPASVKMDAMLLSQSGLVSPYLDANGTRRPLVPGHEGQFVALRVIGLQPSGLRPENRFPLDDKGYVQGGDRRPLGHVPVELRLVDKDGGEYKALVDISPKSLKVSHSGYELIKDLVFTRIEGGEPEPDRDAERAGIRNFAQHGGKAHDVSQAPWTSRLKRE